MMLAGEQKIPAPPSRVWFLLTDETSLARLLPGCEKLERKEADSYHLTMKLGLGAMSGSYAGSVRLREQRPEERLRLTVESRGPWGFVHGDGTLELSEQNGATLVRYAGELQIGGTIASVGQRLLDSAARRVISQFFQNLSQQATAEY
ncbi:MAG: carbon monoxide dehydrogenase subunit G [Terriglobia bacterium]